MEKIINKLTELVDTVTNLNSRLEKEETLREFLIYRKATSNNTNVINKINNKLNDNSINLKNIHEQSVEITNQINHLFVEFNTLVNNPDDSKQLIENKAIMESNLQKIHQQISKIKKPDTSNIGNKSKIFTYNDKVIIHVHKK